MNKPSQATLQDAGEALELQLPKGRLAGFKAGDGLELVSHAGEALLLLKELGAQGYIAGDLTALSVAELMGLIVSGVRTGRLAVSHGASRRTVSFRDGQIVFASSTEPHERLGKVLVRRKLLSRAQLEEALEQVGNGRKLGQILVASKVLSSSALYGAMNAMVKEIVLGLFELEAGHFLFLDGVTSADAVKLPERTKQIVIEGLTRFDEVVRMRRRLKPDRQLSPGSAAPSEEYEALVKKTQGGIALGALRASFEGSEREYLSTIEKLLSERILVLEGEAPLRVVPQPTSPAAQPYVELIGSICAALKQAGKDLSELREFLAEPLPGMEAAFAGVSLSDEGEVSVERVLENLKGQGQAKARAAAYEALDAFVAYALFSAKNALPPDKAEELNAQFRAVQEGVGG